MAFKNWIKLSLLTTLLLFVTTGQSQAKSNPGKILMVVGHDGFWYSEYAIPRMIFEKKGFQVVVASSAQGLAKPMPKSGGDQSIMPDLLLTDADMEDYQAIVFIGGSEPAMKEYIKDPAMAAKAKTLMQSALNSHKVVGGLCHGTGILAAAGILDGRRANGFASLRSMLSDYGAIVVRDSVVVDGLVVTGRDHKVAREFADKVEKLLRKEVLR